MRTLTGCRACNFIFNCARKARFALVFAMIATVSAQQYPDRPINIIVPFPHGAVDVYIRLVQPFAEKQLGQPLLVQNRGGANGAVGTEFVARSKPDGYTLLFNVTSSAVMAPLTMGNARFDILKDFVPITDFVDSPVALVVRKSLPVKNLEEFITYARASQGKLNYGSPGSGSALHLIGISFAKAIGVKMTHVPYKGFAPELQAMMADELDMGFIGTGSSHQHIMKGSIRALALAVGAPPGDYGEIPDLSRTLKGFDNVPIFSALWAPAGTATEIVDRLSAVMRAALADPGVREKFASIGQTTLGRSKEDTAKAVVSNVEVATRLVNEARQAGVVFE